MILQKFRLGSMCDAGRTLYRQISFKAAEWKGIFAGILIPECFSSFQRKERKKRDGERTIDTCLLKPLMEDSPRRPVELEILLLHFLTASCLCLSCQPRHLCILALKT